MKRCDAWPRVPLYVLLIIILVDIPRSLAHGAPRSAQIARPPAQSKNETASRSHNAPIRGIAFHCCSCPVPCPCMFNSKDVEGCDIVRVFHITDGGYIGKHINGLTVVIVPYPELLQKSSKKREVGGKALQARMYLPEGLTKKQESDLTLAIYENYMNIGLMVTERIKAPIKFASVKEKGNASRREADTTKLEGFDVEIPRILHIRTFALPGASGKPVTASHLNLEEGETWTIGKTQQDDFQAPDDKLWQWRLSDTNGSWTNFQWKWYDRP